MNRLKKYFFTGAMLTVTTAAMCQSPVTVGKGSYAEYTPLVKSKTTEHGGDQSQYMQYRTLYISEQEGQPIPTSDWWTDLINADRDRSGQELTGHLWSLPQYVQGMKYGLDIHYPKYWVDNGTEMKSQSKLRLQCGDGFAPSHPMAEQWSDWTVSFSEQSGEQRLLATLEHGVPFTWIELTAIDPVISVVKTDNDGSDNLLTGSVSVDFVDGAGETLSGTHTLSQFACRISNGRTADLYGVYLPAGTGVVFGNGEARVTLGQQGFVVVALLTAASDLSHYQPYAYSKPSDTRVSWTYDGSGRLTTHWNVSAQDLRTGQATTSVLQGQIPHHYRPRYATYSHTFQSQTYATPRGRLRLAAGNSLDISYRFAGMLPWYPVPADTDGTNAFDPSKMLQMLQRYADTGTFGGDTYWGGKGLTQMALNMTFAREMGNEALFRQTHDRLKEAMVNWLTYTPGEDDFFFARDRRFGGLIGYNTSYDSDTYNDHHFHYGYFTLAAALLAMVDDDFRVNYGDMIRLVARDYNNYRRDSWACFLRMMDPWAGHCYAGGLGDGAGNGQESTSESMQGWGGMYLLGVALGDEELRDAGIFGWVTEARATAEYWFDRHGEAIAADFHTQAPDGGSSDIDALYNIDYTKFRHSRDGVVDYTQPWSSNLTSHGIGWWTWFGGDPVFMQGIQWMPISPALDYLGEDKDFAAWDYEQLMALKEHVGWEDYSGNDAWLGNSDWGNVVLSYRQWSDPDDAAAIFDEGWQKGWPTMTTSQTNGITYFVTHSHRTYGDIDWTATASIPTARVYNKDGVKTHIAFNPTDAPVTVSFADGATLIVPARQLKVERVESSAFNYVYPVDDSEPDLRDRLVMRNLAIGKTCTASSFENDGSRPAGATDGSLDTRWGSEHRDGEWLQVDLGEQVSIYKVRVRWEAAYASEYRIELRDSEDGAVVYDKTGTGKGNDWTELTLDDQTGRYLRLVGVKRGTQYGTSLYELEVYGRPQSAADTDLMGVAIGSPVDVLKQGEPTPLTIQGYDYAGNAKSVTATWSSSDGTFSGSTFTPAVYGLVTVAATVSDGSTMNAVKTLPVEEALKLASIELNMPAGMVVGRPYVYTVTGKDQFGAPATVTPTIITDLQADATAHTLTATAPGHYDVTARAGGMEATATVVVISEAAAVPATLDGTVPVFAGQEIPSMNFDYNGGSQRVGDVFALTDDCLALYVKNLGTCGFGSLDNLDLRGANMLHADIYPMSDAPQFSIHIEGEPGNREYAKSLTGGRWNAVDLPVTNTTVTWLFFAFSNYQAGTNEALIANVYFYTETGDKIYVGEPDSRGVVSVTTFGTGINDSNVGQFLTDVAALPKTATAIDLSTLTLGNTEPMTISTPNNPNTILLLNGDGGDDNATSPQADKLTNTQNMAYNAGGWILPLKATGYQVTFVDGYPVLPMNFGRCTTLTYSHTIAAGAYATSCLPRDMAIPTGIVAYELASTQADGIDFDQVTTERLTAYRPYLLHNATTAPITLTISNSQGNVELARGTADLTLTAGGISFVGNFQQFQVTGDEGLAAFRSNGSLAWLATAGTTVGSFRAYLSGITAEQLAVGVRIGGETITGICNTTRKDNHDAAGQDVYTLQGRRVTDPQKGIYLIGKKKIVIR